MFWSSKKSAEGTWQNGRYTSIKTLGQGGFGITYLARDGLLERKVALKEFFLHGSSRVRGKVTPPHGVSSEVFQDQRSKFIDEARALARFSHQSIVRVQDVFEESGTAFIVMEFLEGHTLMERLRERGPLTPTQGEQLTRQLLEALGEVHRAGLLHRDIKPDNLFMAGERPVLIDFGAARQLKTSGAQGMTAILTPGFAPPEQYFSSGVKYGPPTDLYALAATVLFAMTAELVQPAHERAIDPQPLPIPPAGTSSGFAQALRQSLEFKIEARPQSVDAFLALMRSVPPAPAPRPASPAPVIPPRSTPTPRPASPSPAAAPRSTPTPPGSAMGSSTSRVSLQPLLERTLRPLRDVSSERLLQALARVNEDDLLLIAKHLPEFVNFDGKMVRVTALLERDIAVVNLLGGDPLPLLAHALVRLHHHVGPAAQGAPPATLPKTVAAPQGVPLRRPRVSHYPTLARSLEGLRRLDFEGEVVPGGSLTSEDLALLAEHFPEWLNFDGLKAWVDEPPHPDPEVGILDPAVVLNLSTALERLQLRIGRAQISSAPAPGRSTLPPVPLLSERFAKGRYHLWEAETGVKNAQFSRDGRLLALTLHPGSAVLLESVTRREVWTLPLTEVSGLAFDPSGLTLYAAHGKLVSSWHPLERRRLAQWELRDGPLSHLAVGSDYWVAADASGYLHLQPLEGDGKRLTPSGTLIAEGAEAAVQALVLAPGTQLMAYARMGSAEVAVDKLPTGKRFRSLQVESEVRALAFDASGRRLAVGCRDGTVRLWDVPTGQFTGTFLLGEPLHTLGFNPNGEYLMASGADGRVTLCKVATQTREAAEGLPPSPLVWASLSGGGQFMAWGSGRAVRLLQLAAVPPLPASTWLTSTPPTTTPPPEVRAQPPSGSNVVSTSPPRLPSTLSSTSAVEVSSPASSTRAPSPEPCAPETSGLPSGVLEKQAEPSAGPVPYQKSSLSLEGVELSLQMSDTLARWLRDIVEVEGPIRREDACRRLFEAAGGRKLGARLAESLEAATHYALAQRLFEQRQGFLWPHALIRVPVRDRSALPPSEKVLESVCDEELLQALERVSKALPHLPPKERFSQALRLLGFFRLTTTAEARLHSLNV